MPVHDWCPQPPPSMRKGPCTLAIYSGSRLLASKEGQGHSLHRTREGEGPAFVPSGLRGQKKGPTILQVLLHHHLSVKRSLTPSPEEDGLFKVLTATGLSQGTYPECVVSHSSLNLNCLGQSVQYIESSQKYLLS